MLFFVHAVKLNKDEKVFRYARGVVSGKYVLRICHLQSYMIIASYIDIKKVSGFK